MQFHEVRNFYVTDCDDGVVFRTNAFRDLGKLQNLYLGKVRKVEFESGVFQRLARLSLQNIQDVKFGERAFMGARDLYSIEIHRATIPRLHSHSLFDVRGLYSLELDEVALHHVEKDAVKIDFRHPESYVLVNNCTIGNIESKGIILKAKNFSMTKSALDGLSSDAVNIISSDLIQTSESNFGKNLEKNAINMVAPVVNIRSNTFKLLPKGIIEGIKFEENKKIIFINNTVYDIDTDNILDGMSSLIKIAEIKGNHFPCSCSIRVPHQALREFSQNNFCTIKCNITLSDFGALIEDRKVCTLNKSEPDESEICSSVVNSTPDQRRGRTPSYFRTTQITTKMNKTVNSSERIQFIPVLLFCVLFTVVIES
ncbi:hypothetical protein B7P43_G06444 [Cryptotermes secundus]|nr:hypothetical protein B7P43_G06444 [Cryptotermes secundus]